MRNNAFPRESIHLFLITGERKTNAAALRPIRAIRPILSDFVILTSHSMAQLAEDVGFEGPPFKMG
jgi:hypothetical protein